MLFIVEDELVKVVRISRPTDQCEAQEFTQRVLAGVRFAPLVSFPTIKTVILARIWSPSLHRYYPDSFRNSCKTLLLCSHANYDTQPVEPIPPKELVNVASMLPRALWMEIMSYTHRDCKTMPCSFVESCSQTVSHFGVSFVVSRV
jgi:hypothetical protein